MNTPQLARLIEKTKEINPFFLGREKDRKKLSEYLCRVPQSVMCYSETTTKCISGKSVFKESSILSTQAEEPCSLQVSYYYDPFYVWSTSQCLVISFYKFPSKYLNLHRTPEINREVSSDMPLGEMHSWNEMNLYYIPEMKPEEILATSPKLFTKD